MAPARVIQVKVLVTSEEREQLAEIARSKGLTASDVVRQIIRRQFASLRREERGPADSGA
jgi:hypothetical protein